MEEIDQYKERLRIALKAAKICIFEVDLLRQLYTYFENAEVIFGVSGDDILSDVRPYSFLEPEEYRRAVSAYFSHPDDAEVIAEAFKCMFNGEPAVYEARMKAGGSPFVWCRINITPILENGKPVRMVGVITDITDVKERTESLELAANLDGFTGLYNKGYTISLINNILRKNQHLKHALMVLDIDDFKKFNDTYGHIEGDKVIHAVSEQIKNTFRKSDVVGRFGGDEFIIFIQDIGEARWLCNKFPELTRVEAGRYTCTNSVGVAIFPEDAANFNELFKKADAALYRAKAHKGKVVVFGGSEEEPLGDGDKVR